MADDQRMKRLLITGSRDWHDREIVASALFPYAEQGGWILVHGACPSGADQIASDIWRGWGQAEEMHPANWRRHGRRAGIIRNQEMVDLGADQCIAFRLNDSRGTTHCANAATMAGIPTDWIVEYE